MSPFVPELPADQKCKKQKTSLVAPFSPQIRTFATLPLNQALSEFVGRGGSMDGELMSELNLN